MGGTTAKKTLSFVIEASNMTAELLKSVLRSYLDGNRKYKGKTSYRKLSSQGKLDSIEITENNIKDFLSTARKYDIDYALKRDKSTNPPTYYVFFTAGNADVFKQAFEEYAVAASKKLSDKSISQVINREQIKQNAKTISAKQNLNGKEKHRSKSDISR